MQSSIFRKFLSDSIVYALPSFLTRGLSIILVPLYTRVLNPSDYGILDIFSVFTSIINLTVAFEISQAVARFYSGETNTLKRRQYASTALWFTTGCYFIYALVAISFSDFFSNILLNDSSKSYYFNILILSNILSGIFYLLQNQLRWDLNSKSFALLSLLLSIITATSSVFFLYVFNMRLEGMLWGLVVGYSTCIIYGFYKLRNIFGRLFETTLLLQMLKFSIPLVPSGLAIWISGYLDRIMINKYLSLESVGIYGMGFRIASIISMVMIGFQSALTPLVYKYYNEKSTPAQIERIFRFFIMCSIILFLVLTLFARDILKLMTNEQYYAGESVVILIIPSIILSQMYIFIPGISIAKKTHWFIWLNLLAALLNIVLNILLITPLGIIGAALATLISYLLVFVLHYNLSQKLYFIPFKLERVVLLSIVSFTIAYFIPHYFDSNYLRWLSSLIAIFFILIISIQLKVVAWTDIKKIRKGFLPKSLGR